MKAPMTHRNLPRFLGALAAAALCILALGAGSAGAALAIKNFDGEVIQEGGEPATQAGSHPYEASTEFDFSYHVEEGLCFPNSSSPNRTGLQGRRSGAPRRLRRQPEGGAHLSDAPTSRPLRSRSPLRRKHR